MILPAFHEWLRSFQDAPEADRLAMLIAQSGAAGVSLDRLRRVVGLPSEVLSDLLKSLVATGQVRMLRVNGELTYQMVA